MIILIGTKGQLIKTAGVMKELDRRDVDYLFVQADQHPRMNIMLRRQLGLPHPLYLHAHNDDIITIKDLFAWVWRCIRGIIRNKDLFENQELLITQGDTMSTLLACMVAKIFKLKLAHIESGLRSYSFLHPFPEELIRRIVTRFADYLFAPGDWAANNLKHHRGKVVNTKQNTVYDVLCEYAKPSKKSKYVVAAIHRQETIYNFLRFLKAVSTVHTVHRDMYPVKYILHPPSERMLKQCNMYNGLVYKGIELLPYQDYLTFMRMVAGAEFVITDGGGLQEETYYLNVPCMILRNKTERLVGLNETAFLVKFDDRRRDWFLKNYRKFKRDKPFKRYYPSKIIVDALLGELK